METTIRVRTEDDFDTILRHKCTMSWRCNKVKLSSKLYIEIYNWEGSERIRAEIDHQDTFIDPRNGKSVICFLNPVREECNMNWTHGSSCRVYI